MPDSGAAPWPHLRSGASVTRAPESAHAIRVAPDEVLECKETGEKKVIAFRLSGHGHFDTPALAKRIPAQVGRIHRS